MALFVFTVFIHNFADHNLANSRGMGINAGFSSF